MIIDLSAFTGSWPFYPVMGDLESVRNSLQRYGIERIFVSPLDAVWCRNPHIFNNRLYQAAGEFSDVWPVPVLDPTIATWRKELEKAIKQTKVRLIRLLPAYSPYKLSDANVLLEALVESGLGVIVQTRIEDPRRQHSLAQVPDVPASEVADAAKLLPDLKVVIGGPRKGEILALKDCLLDLPNLYADISQAEGMNAIQEMTDAGLADKLVFGSHAPFFIPHSALARLMMDADNDTAEAILWNNTMRIIEG